MEQGLIISNRNKQHYHLLLCEEWGATRRGGSREIIVNAAANSHLQKGTLLRLCLWQGLEGLVHSSSQAEAFCMLEVSDFNSSGTNLISWRCRLWLCRIAKNSFLLVRDRGELKSNKLTILFLPSFFRLFMRLKRQSQAGGFATPIFQCGRAV